MSGLIVSEKIIDRKIAAANNGNGNSGPGYLSYVALLDQSGTDAPIPTILTNTIGNIVWSYLDVGNYKATLAGAFPSGKVWLSVTNNDGALNSFIFYSYYNGDDLELDSYVLNNGGGGGALQRVGVNNQMFQTPIEIRVYP